jgi:hypothetical protein
MGSKRKKKKILVAAKPHGNLEGDGSKRKNYVME